MIRVPRQTVAELLAKSIEQGEALLQRASLIGDFSDYESWKGTRKLWTERTAETLARVYDNPEARDEFRSAASNLAGAQQWQVEYRRDSGCVQAAIDVLLSLQQELEQTPAVGVELEQEPADHAEPAVVSKLQQGPADHGDVPEQPPDPGSQSEPGSELEPGFAFTNGSPPPLPATTSPATARNGDAAGQVFLVHGRDEKLKQAVAELLERAGSHEVTILNERPSDRRMLVERFDEQPAGSRYAVVLLTADDVGAPRVDSQREPYFSPRARQGVVFEMGVLVAALTPRRMCVLYEDGVELPFDLDGIAYVRLDLAGTWQSKLLLHMRGAGFDYDLNRLAPI